MVYKMKQQNNILVNANKELVIFSNIEQRAMKCLEQDDHKRAVEICNEGANKDKKIALLEAMIFELNDYDIEDDDMFFALCRKKLHYNKAAFKIDPRDPSIFERLIANLEHLGKQIELIKTYRKAKIKDTKKAAIFAEVLGLENDTQEGVEQYITETLRSLDDNSNEDTLSSLGDIEEYFS
jgi:hypothetical protein